MCLQDLNLSETVQIRTPGATPELRRVADTTSHGLSAGRHSTQTQTTIGSPSLCGQPKGGRGGERRGGEQEENFRTRASRQVSITRCASPDVAVDCGMEQHGGWLFLVRRRRAPAQSAPARVITP